jgi:excisionase family DNA binding protein
MIRDESFPPKRIAADLFDQPASVAPRRLPSGRTPNPSTDIPFMQRPTCTINEACKAAGMGRTKFYELIKGGDLKTISIGRRRLVHVPSLLKFLKIDFDDQ